MQRRGRGSAVSAGFPNGDEVSSVEMNDLDESLERINPSEVLLRKDLVSNIVKSPAIKGRYSHNPYLGLAKLIQSPVLQEHFLTGVPGSWFTEDTQDLRTDDEDLGDSIGDMEGMDFTNEGEKEWFDNFRKGVSKLEACAMRALLLFIKYTQKGSVPYLSAPSKYHQANHMIIDASTRRALELTIPHMHNAKSITLLGTIDRTRTAQGARLLASRLASPSTNMDIIQERLNQVDLFFNDVYLRNGLIGHLEKCQDLERSVQKVVTNSCGVNDLHIIKNTLHKAGTIKDFIISNCQDKSILKNQLAELGQYSDLINELDRALSTDNTIDYIADGFSPELDELRHKKTLNNKKVTDIVADLLNETSVKFSLVTYKGFMRVLEVTKSKIAQADRCPSIVKLEHTQHRAKYTHPELQKLNMELVSLECKYSDMQLALYKTLCEKITDRVDDIMMTASALAQLDVASSLANLACEKSYCKPTVVEDEQFMVVNGFHPVVASNQNVEFISNNCKLNGKSIWLITGPNMGGKSTFLRQNAIISILAQMGSFVPAQLAVLGITDRLFARIGASDNVSRHMSTFQNEMTDTSHILVNATSRSLIILDEIGRGTAYSEGLAIAGAVVEYIHDKIGCRCLVATHYHQLALMMDLPRVSNYKFTVTKSQSHIIFHYKIQPGFINHSYALDVAGLTGLPREVLVKAQELLDSQSPLITKPELAGAELSEEHADLVESKMDSDASQTCSSLTTKEKDVLTDLRNFAVDRATPLEALNLINKLKNHL